MWNVVSVPSQVHNDWTIPVIYNKGYIVYCLYACPKRPYFHFSVKSHVTIVFLGPNFLSDTGISAIRIHLTQL